MPDPEGDAEKFQLLIVPVVSESADTSPDCPFVNPSRPLLFVLVVLVALVVLVVVVEVELVVLVVVVEEVLVVLFPLGLRIPEKATADARSITAIITKATTIPFVRFLSNLHSKLHMKDNDVH